MKIISFKIYNKCDPNSFLDTYEFAEEVYLDPSRVISCCPVYGHTFEGERVWVWVYDCGCGEIDTFISTKSPCDDLNS